MRLLQVVNIGIVIVFAFQWLTHVALFSLPPEARTHPNAFADGFNSLIRVREYYPLEKIGMFASIQTRHSATLGVSSLIEAEQMKWVEPAGSNAYWLLSNVKIQRWDEAGRRISSAASSRGNAWVQNFLEYRLETDLMPQDLEADPRRWWPQLLAPWIHSIPLWGERKPSG